MSQANLVEKKADELPGINGRSSTTKLSKVKAIAFKTILVTALAISASTYFVKRPLNGFSVGTLESGVDLCPQADELVPEKNGVIWESLQLTYGTEAFKAKAIDWLGGAVRIPCVYSACDMLGVCAKYSPHVARKHSMTWEM
jgi:Gly-Xaa carboxypeptidase